MIVCSDDSDGYASADDGHAERKHWYLLPATRCC